LLQQVEQDLSRGDRSAEAFIRLLLRNDESAMEPDEVFPD
jgi:hypothetical protein